VALWVNGDAKGEALRFQFRDSAGAYADWVLPMDFTGWRLLVFKTADRPEFNWQKVEYVIFYFNNIPPNATVTMKFDDLKALPKLRKPPLLSGLRLTINEKEMSIPGSLDLQDCLTLDWRGTCTLWPKGITPGEQVGAAPAPPVLKPGANVLKLTCDSSQDAPRDVLVRVIRLGLTEP
jgi:hypothetical protein